jgi:hypothetical protein
MYSNRTNSQAAHLLGIHLHLLHAVLSVSSYTLTHIVGSHPISLSASYCASNEPNLDTVVLRDACGNTMGTEVMTLCVISTLAVFGVYLARKRGLLLKTDPILIFRPCIEPGIYASASSTGLVSCCHLPLCNSWIGLVLT